MLNARIKRCSPIVRCIAILNQRAYHSDNGVYGCYPKQSRSDSKKEVIQKVICERRSQNSDLYRLVTSYRTHGHLRSESDPLRLFEPEDFEELKPTTFNLNDDKETYDLKGIVNIDKDKATLKEIVEALDSMYCGSMTAEFMHAKTLEEREWFAQKYEEIQGTRLTEDERIKIAKTMAKAQAFDHFVANKFTTVKRYGGEGGESAMAFYEELFKIAAESHIESVVVCIAHRGRLNLLSCLMDFPPVELFRKMKGLREFPEEVKGSGDVLSHLSTSVDLKYDDNSVHVSMVPNPSHLEAINPVAMGKTRAKLQFSEAGEYSTDIDTSKPNNALCLQIHGDAAFAGQGIVSETFAISEVPHFSVGGSIHLIHNNQVGFTTDPGRGRSSLYSSCTGKMTGVPVIRVNADHPEDVVKACRLAVEYRNRFGKDIIVDYICFRKHGHNELDEPSFTQPKMYKAIRSRDSIPDTYTKQLAEEGICSESEIKEVVSDWNGILSENYNNIDSYKPKAHHLERQWSGLVQPDNSVSSWDTGLPEDLLRFVGAKSVEVAEDFRVHPTLMKSHIQRRLERMRQGTGIDWAMAEALAVGSLLYQGYHVRISGQDVGRGTFSHRHAMFVDQETDGICVPLNHMKPDQQGFYEVCNSILSEEAVMGFEYGMSIENPNILVIWEAQFGDFFNGAQIIIDTFLSNGESKWLKQSGMVVLLPHGMDGAGPEHSSCKIERFLQLTDSKEDGVDGDDVNMQIANPTTPAQYYHLLRRQMLRNFRKPLVIAAPKTVLRLPAAVSSLQDMAPGTTFKPVLGDSGVDPKNVKKVVFVSGKHYYTLQSERESRGVKDIAFVRIEQLCPFPVEEIRNELDAYKNATDFIWAQEEHRNQGPWTFISPRFENVVGKKLKYSGREVLGQSAAGVGQVHRQENDTILQSVFA